MIMYREHEGILSESLVYEIASLAKILDQQAEVPITSYVTNLTMGLAGRVWVHVGLAYDGAELIAYKLGRSDDPRCFESWRGGVKAAYRRRGIATHLAQCQEDWCRSQKFSSILTYTAPDNIPMLIVNLKRGFTVSGTILVRGAHMNVALHKSIV